LLEHPNPLVEKQASSALRIGDLMAAEEVAQGPCSERERHKTCYNHGETNYRHPTSGNSSHRKSLHVMGH